ncbi:SRPBCC family protein [Pseudarthrobacter sp. NamE5]|uniref:SRPBCC family protein n=1 Tax=Pseudarthrobacter sp. NamE5 TaxID=2576839 RepID=UPI00110C04CB|nr:SRPBCC family protein [Pseudarthrobacter sp. NamE5]TLM85745.1 polyketide cyclase [Pseudarthrobacter sp. NamE5]
MASYWFITTWKFVAPIGKVWEAVGDSASYPQWFSLVSSVSLVREGDRETGVGSVYRTHVNSKLPYSLSFELETVRRIPPHLLEVTSAGELEGSGRWDLTEENGVTSAVFHWYVRTTKPWMNVTAPLLRGIFALNHKKVMDEGGEQLARYLGARLVGNYSHEEKQVNL